MQIGILGGGTMGEIITRALIQREVVGTPEIMIAEVDAARREELAELEVGLTDDLDELLAFAEVLVVCVKPQNARSVLLPLRGVVRPETLVISIMAGIDTPFLVDILDHPQVIRSMPNLPARIGQGMTVWRSAPDVPDHMRLIAKMIFQSMGREVEVDDEDLLDAGTAVSGTGPAYIFYIAENLLEAARAFGFDDAQALKLVRGTFRGAMDLWAQTNESPAVLRQKVTSKGGTTHAAMTYFDSADIARIFRTGVGRARERAKELAQIAKESP